MTASKTEPLPAALLEAPLARTPGAAALQRQLHQRFRTAILDGRMAPGSRLPGSRALAEAFAISRNTVTAAYELLAAEGYVLPDRQGTRVARLKPSPVLMTRASTARSTDTGPSAAQPMARRLARIQPTAAPSETTLALRPGVPALSHFPLAAWRRAVDQALRHSGPQALGYGDPLGEPALRGAIAHHLAVSRGARCEPSQVVVTEGAQEALLLCVRLLTNPGERAWLEDPGYRGAKAAMFAGDLRIVPMPVDAEGLVASPRDWQTRTPRLVYTTPSHQYPLGAVMSVARRLALIDNARRFGAWIVEDDYDSEFRHAGEPIGSMQGLAEGAPVLYVGTFSKTMFPSLRLGFLVLPESLLARLEGPLSELLRGGHRHEQLAMAAFMESGQFARHLGRMRRLYRGRQEALRDALGRHLRVPHGIEGGHSGLHLTLRLPAGCADTRVAEAARAHGMAPAPLSGFAMRAGSRHNGLVLGYGNTSAELFEPLVQRLDRLVRAAKAGR